MDNVAGGVAIEEREEVGDAAPSHIWGIAVDRREVDQELLQSPGRRRSIGQAVHSQGLGGYALADLGLMVGVGEQLQVGMRVHIDEARADHVAAGVDGAAGVDRRRAAGYDLDGVARDGNAGPIAGGPGAIDHRAVGK